MQKITPFLSFNDQAEEAVGFYTSIFPDSEITNVTRYGEAGPGKPGDVMVMSFTLFGQPYVALNGTPFKFTEAISLMVDCESQAEVDRYWDALTADGGEGVGCGWLKDRFGLFWQITPRIMGSLIGGPDAEGSQRAMTAMMGMVKLDIAALQRAYDG